MSKKNVNYIKNVIDSCKNNIHLKNLWKWISNIPECKLSIRNRLDLLKYILKKQNYFNDLESYNKRLKEIKNNE